MAQHFFWALSECVGDLMSDHCVLTVFVGLIYMGLVRRILRPFVSLVGCCGMLTIFVGHNCGWLGAACSVGKASSYGERQVEV